VSIPDGDEMLYLDQLTPDSELQVRDWTGTAFRCTPCRRVTSCSPATRHTPSALQPAGCRSSPPTPSPKGPALLKRLDLVRRDGYAWALEEFALG
jgi:DNA-binding IclR family transcriptional regulator